MCSRQQNQKPSENVLDAEVDWPAPNNRATYKQRHLLPSAFGSDPDETGINDLN